MILSFPEVDSISDPLRNNKKVHTMVIRYPPNKRYYIALTQDSFANVICGRIGSVNSCFFLHLLNVHKPLKPFSLAKTLDLLQVEA